MIRYVAMGAVVGFLFAYFLLSHSSEDVTAPPVDPPAPVILPTTHRPTDMMRLRQLPSGMAQRIVSDAGQP